MLINSLISIILFVTYLVLGYFLKTIGLLSNKFLLSTYFVVLLLVIIIVILLLKRKKLPIILGIIGIIINIIGIYYLNSTSEFINSFGKEKKYDYYYLVSLKLSSYNKVNDLENKIIGMSDNIKEDVLKKIDIKYQEKKYANIISLKERLYEKEVDALILSESEEYLIEEDDDTFAKKVKIISKIKLKKENLVKGSNKKIIKEPFIVYISGIDTSGVISNVGRSDVNIIATVNPNEKQVLLTTIPRDYYVTLNGTSGLRDKLTHAGIYGINKSILTIGDLLRIKIDYYARINFDTVTNLVDSIGNIIVNSDQNLSFCNIKKGINELDGKCALRYARERHSYKTGDRHRGENQEEVIRAIINKVQDSKVLLTKYSSILKSLENNLETNITDNEIKSLISMQIKEMPKWNIKTYNLNGYDSSNFTFSMGSKKLYVMEPDYNTVNNASKYINMMLDNKTFVEIGI